MSLSETDREVVRLWRVWRTVHEMCQDRGYEFSNTEVTMDMQTFKDRFAESGGGVSRSRMTFTANPSDEMMKKHAGKAGSIVVEFFGGSNIGVKEFRAFAERVDSSSHSNGLLITAAPVTSGSLKIIPAVLPTIIETFQEADLLINITRHELVPLHILLSNEEKKALLERYRVKETQLPRIQVEDPVARYFGLKRGQVVKIIRDSQTAGRYASYRWAI